MTESVVKWRKKYETGIPLIDGQHRGLLEMTNRLAFVYPQEDVELFLDAGQITLELMRQHFGTEEKLMLLLDYADYPAHKAAHEDCAGFSAAGLADIERNGLSAAPGLIGKLREWLVVHFAEYDQKFARFLKRLRRLGKLEAVLGEMPRPAPLLRQAAT